jgi:chemosensory pili system protein ChpA (sensor histidine kinase/response regulator)
MSYLFVIDDHADSREALARFLERAGHEVATASEGREALHAILNRIPDVIVLDLFMPEMDGLELLEVLRSYVRLRSLRVVILTAYPDSALTETARELGVRRVLPKARATFEDILDAVHAELWPGTEPPPDPGPSAHLGGW